MSRLWREDSGADAVRIATSGLASVAAGEDFAPWAGVEGGHAPVRPAAPRAPGNDIEAIRAAAYAEGLADGRHTVEQELIAERAALGALAESLEAVQPEAPEALAAVLAEVVGRLVRQIVGEVEISDRMVRERVEAVANIVAEQGGPARMRLNPEDVARLGRSDFDFAVLPDPHLLPGSVVVETASGWIEHGVEAGMERLRQALDQMAVAR